MSTQATSQSPPRPPQTFDPETFRQTLAGLTDPDYSDDAAGAADEYKASAIDLCLCLCELFGESLDRTTLWDRIASALATAAAKANDGNTDRFASLCLDHVRADPGQASRHDRFSAWLTVASAKPMAWRQGVVRYVVGHSYALIAHARLAWEKVKAGRNGGGR